MRRAGQGTGPAARVPGGLEGVLETAAGGAPESRQRPLAAAASFLAEPSAPGRRHPERRRLVAGGVLAVVLLAAVGAGAAKPAAEPTRDALERRVVQGLAAGTDVAPLLAELDLRAGSGAASSSPTLRHPSSTEAPSTAHDAGRPSPRRLRPPASGIPGQVREALRDLHRELPQSPSQPARRSAASTGTTANSPAGTASVTAEADRLLARYDALRATDLLARESFRATARRLDRAGLVGEVAVRLETARAHYESEMDALLAALERPFEQLRRARRDGEPPDLGAPRSALAKVGDRLETEPAFRILGNGLPYRSLASAPRPPRTTPAVTPVYLDLADPGSRDSDLAPTVAAPLTAEIRAQAETLGFDPVRIFEFVRNDVVREWYAGAMKGATGALRHRSGNDVDQAALLVALFRASSVPARFVHGVIELPLADLQAELGLEAAAVADYLARSGVPHRPVVRGGRVAAFEVEHTWVAAHVPYTNYRGTVVDLSGRTWIALMPSLGRVELQRPPAVLQALGFSAEDFVASYLAAPRSDEPLAVLRGEVGAFLVAERPGESYDDQLGARVPVVERLGLLPSSLPVRVVAVTGESAEVPEELLHRVRLRLHAGVDAASPVVLDRTLPLLELADRRLTLSYLPATVDDQRTVHAFGGLEVVPAFLVRVRPQLRRDGRLLAVGEEAGLPLGERHRLEVTLTAPAASATAERTVVAGAYHALQLAAQHHVPVPEPAEELDGEELAARLLARVGSDYGAAWDRAEDELAGLFDVALARPLAALSIVTNEVVVEDLLGLAQVLRWQGVSLDAVARIAEPVARGGEVGASTGEVAPGWMAVSALQGSALEHRVFEESFRVAAVSADRGLGLARLAGQSVLTVSAANVDAVLPTLDHSAAVLADVEDRARQGLVVEIPSGPVSYAAWTGSTWRVEDPATGSAGYFLAGGLAGGATAEEPGEWLVQLLAQTLATPYSSEPNPDPFAAASIVKILETDGQEDEVGTRLRRDLAVVVRDEDGRPVQGAPVEFRVTSGGGSFLVDQERRAVAVVPTNSLGLAAVPFELGTDTALDPVYLRRYPSDEHLSRALANLVEATVTSSGGVRVLASPFLAHAFPGRAVTLRRTNGSGAESLEPYAGLWVDTLVVAAEDRYGNPVANQRLTFRAGAPVLDATCSNPPVDPRPAAVFLSQDCPVDLPVLGDCGGAELTASTSIFGVGAGVILGDAVNAVYPVEVEASGLDPLHFDFHVAYVREAASGRCSAAVDVIQQTSSLIDAEGNIIQAARPGSTYLDPIDIHLLFLEPEHRVEFDPAGDGTGTWRLELLPQGSWVRTTGDFEVTVSNGGSAQQPLPQENGSYRTFVHTSLTPTRHDVGIDGVVDARRPSVDPVTGVVGSVDVPVELVTRVTEVWGVDPRIVRIAPSPIPLTDQGTAAETVYVHYQVSPGEYRARDLEVRSFAGEDFVGQTAASARSGSGFVQQQRGFAYDPNLRHSVELVLNAGSAAELRSGRVDLPVRQLLFRNVSASVVLAQEVDVVNQRTCEQPDQFHFGLNRRAEVTLTFRGLTRLADGGFEPDGSEFVLLADILDEGEHGVDVLPADLPPGEYHYELRGVTTLTGAIEVRRGFARSTYRERNALPVGHVLVEGVDLFDGHLVIQREDLAVPGRGPALAFGRAYSSSGGGEGGPLGLGWTHSYDSRLFITPCGEVILSGGDGSGARFVDDGEGGLRPLAGQHGSLIAHLADRTFDYYAKAGTRYHYRPGRGGEWLLDHVEDPSGNTTRLSYEASPFDPQFLRLVAVEDPSGRRLRFTWEGRQFHQWSGDVVTRVEGPDGLAMSFLYDGWGNLVRAEREAHADGSPSRAESYEYELQPDNAYDDRHVLVAVRDEVGGGETRYTWGRGAVGLQGTVQVPTALVRSVTRPEGGVTRFDIGLAELAARAPETTVEVTDPRDQLTRYTLNRYGSPVRVEDPLEEVTTMEWAADDVVMTARTDARGVRTDYTYDEHGNLLTESVEVTGTDGAQHLLQTVLTYHPPEAFDPPHLKERIATRTDRTGATTRFEYDSVGRLVRQEIDVTPAAGGAPERIATTRTWLANGDLATETDPRGHTASFAYDVHGQLVRATDPLGGVTRQEWDVRGRLRSRTDPLGRRTQFRHDTLGRQVEIQPPAVSGELEAPVERMIYDDMARIRTRIDLLGRASVEHLDREGRPVERIDAAGARQVLAYDGAGKKVLESTWFDDGTPRHDTTFTYDATGRLERREEPLGRVTVWTYDAVGNPVRESLSDVGDPDFAPRVTEHAYDELGRRIESRRLTDTEPAVTRTAYDGEGRPVETVDPLGRVTRLRYDELGRAVERIEPPWRDGEPRVTTFLYDGKGNLLDERLDNAPAPRIRRYAYDALDRRVQATDGTGGVTLSEYDAVGNLLRRIDPLLDVTAYGYDARNRRVRETLHLTRVTQPSRQVVTEYGYDAVGNRVEERWPNGNLVAHAYDALDRKLRTEDSLGLVESATWDARGNRLTATDANGHTATTTYDALDRVVRVEMPEARVVQRTWDVAGNLQAETDPRNGVTRRLYDRLDRTVEEVDALGRSTLFTYDLVGNVLTRTDRRGFTTRYEHDALNRVVRTVDPPEVGTETTTAYDAADRPVRVVDRRGLATETIYDAEGRPIEVRREGTVLEQRGYDAAGNLRFLTDANGHTTGYEYDERGLLLAENRPLAAITRHTLDDLGDRVSTRDPEGRVSTFGYDLRRRMVTEADPAEATTTYGYDGVGNRTSVRRPEGNTWLYRYDAAGRLAEVEDPDGEATAFTWDGNGNRLSHTDANDHTNSFEYDAEDRMTAKVYPGAVGETYAHDEEGHPTSRTDANGQVTTWAYDALGREVLRSYSPPAEPTGDDLSSIATVHDGNGNPLRTTETYIGATGVRETVRTYDVLDRLVTVTDPQGERLSYGYDPNGNRTRLTDPDGQVTRYAFDSLNRPIAVTTPGAGVTEYLYLRDGRLREVRYPNGTTATHGYDAAGRTATIENRHHTGLVSRFAYQYDLNGNRALQTEENGAGIETTTYAYDALDRLLEVEYPDRTTTYAYDPVGNRLSETAVATAGGTLLVDRLYEYDDRDRLLSLTDRLSPDGSATFTYDPGGNRRSKTTGTGEATQYLYDSRNRLAEVRRNGVLLETYRYDHQGLRIRRSGPEGIVHAVYDDTSLLLETDTAGNTLRKYEYGPDRLLSLSESTAERRFYLFDALDSVANLVSPAGTVEARYTYDAWGNLRRESGTTENPFAFTSHRLDRPTGLYYAQQRYYDPELGLFLTEDPVAGTPDRPPSLHRYLYAYQNPGIYVDPDGRAGRLKSEQPEYKWSTEDDIPPGTEYWVVVRGEKTTYYSTNPEDWPDDDERGYRLAGQLADGRRQKEEALWQKAWRWIFGDIEDAGVAARKWSENFDERQAEGMTDSPGENQKKLERVQGQLADSSEVVEKSGKAALSTADTVALVTTTAVVAGTVWVAKGKIVKEVSEEAVEELAEDGWRVVPRGTAGLDDLLQGGRQVSGRFPRTAGPNEVLLRRDATGRVTHYQVFDEQGLPLRRVDVTGRSHGDIPTPHVLEFERHVNPTTGEVFVKSGRVREALPEEIP